MGDRPCPHCSGPGGPYAEALCHACYRYQRRNNRPRPAHPIDRHVDRWCDNCGKHMSGPLRHGRCEACSRYIARTGVERPAELFRRGEADAADDSHLDTVVWA